VLQYVNYIPGSNDGLDFHAMCSLQQEPTSEKSQWIEASQTRPPGGSPRQILWAELRGWTRFIELQIEYSLME
jgi:hypothetical protein